jgi:hypothetical protein
MTIRFPERCLWRRRKTKKKTCNDITLTKIRTTRDLVWWMKCHPQLVLQVVSILLSGYSRMKNNEKQKLDDIIKNQATIEEQLEVNIKSVLQNREQFRKMLLNNAHTLDSG